MTSLAGKKILITAGPTYEPIDPVRFIGNHSSGKMGYALATEAQKRGAIVTLVSGPTSLASPDKVETIRVQSSDEMYAACDSRSNSADIIILAAAVADYKPAHVALQKIKKKDDDMNIPLVKTIDIAQELGKRKLPNQRIIGFALETNNEVEHAKSKLSRKNFDFIVLNSMQNTDSCFGSNNNQITIISKDDFIQYPNKSKEEVANDILDHLISLYA